MITRPSMMIVKRVVCGSVYCNFVETKVDGKFHKLMLFSDMTKEAPCGSAMLQSIQQVLTYALRRGFEEDNVDTALINQMLNQRCNARADVPTWNKKIEWSCTDAISKAVKDYIKIKAKKKKKEKGKDN